MENKKYFASANTNKGFENNFNNILDYSRPSFRYVIKGGSGTGKSTLMKKVADYFINKGEIVEFFYCSSDKDSLDGIRLANKNIAIVDGTAPHITEAELPEIDDSIVNVGQFIGESVKNYEKEIKELVLYKKKIYSDIYNILSAIGYLSLINDDVREDVVDKNLEILKTISLKGAEGKKRELFITSIAEDGLFSYENQFKNTVELNANTLEFEKIMKMYLNILDNARVNYIKFKSITNSSFTQGIYINDSDVYITKLKCLNKFSDVCDDLLKVAGEKIKEAKILHKKIEKYYIESMNFEGLDKLTDDLIQRINRINY